MGLQTIYPKKNLSKRNQLHKVYPYLLKNLKIVRPNQVWQTDITYIPLNRGRSRAVLALIHDCNYRCV